MVTKQASSGFIQSRARNVTASMMYCLDGLVLTGNERKRKSYDLELICSLESDLAAVHRSVLQRLNTAGDHRSAAAVEVCLRAELHCREIVDEEERDLVAQIVLVSR